MQICGRFPYSVAAVALLLNISAAGQTYKSQLEHPVVRYHISAQLHPEAKQVKGRYRLTWRNHTDDAIPDLYFHLYLNAFKNMHSTFMRESAISRRQNLLSEWKAIPEETKWGWVDVESMRVVDGPDLTGRMRFAHPDDGNTEDQTVMQVVLPEPIPPRGFIVLDVSFTAKLPRAVARTGFAGDYFLVAQWFPKIGVYEAKGEHGRLQGGWNCHQFHANTEFYADFGVYDVDLTVPTQYVVGATGRLRHSSPNPDGTTTHYFYQEDVHDFAWTASPHFRRLARMFNWHDEVRPEELETWSRILQLPPDQVALRDVEVILLLQPAHRHLADRYFRAAFNGLKHFGLWYGAYPYDTLTVVDPARRSNTGGMEYPTFITGGTAFWPGRYEMEPEGVTVHEFGHQYWYGLVASNEFEEAWLDEGLTTYSTHKALRAAYPRECRYLEAAGIPIPGFAWLSVKPPAFPFAGVGKIPLGPYFSCLQPTEAARRESYLRDAKDDELIRRGWEYMSGASYGVNSYIRPALALASLENYLGSDTMARVLRTYHQRWRFRHPTMQDLVAVVNEVSGRDMSWFFEQFFASSNILDYAVTQIENLPRIGKVGVYDEGGKKVTYLEKPAQEPFDRSKEKRYRSTVLVRRLGEAIAPVEVVVNFENGETVHESWEGKYRWAKFIYEKATKVRSAQVDPYGRWQLDANLVNNSYTSKADNRTAAAWYVRWIFWLENLFFAAGFFA